jgi:hypothetical protein
MSEAETIYQAGVAEHRPNQPRLFEDDSAVRDWERLLRSIAPRQ